MDMDVDYFSVCCAIAKAGLLWLSVQHIG